MELDNRVYIAIDLKSFYASIECVERGLDPFTTNLVVADESRTEKTICLAVSPSLRKYGIPSRARLFEVIQKCKEVKAETGQDIEYIIAEPRMQLYMDYSSRIYQIYLKYISCDDIHVYSVDEVFIDVTEYLNLYKDDNGNPISAYNLAMKIIKDVYKTTGITATVGIGTNLYLAKIAMDIVAKRIEANEDGVRIAQLDEYSYKKLLWEHKPLTDFWRIGKGISKKLEMNGMYTMGDVAKMSVSKMGYGTGEDFLYKLFGVDAELLIDHAWGIETCTMKDIKNYKPMNKSISSGQVLSCSYSWEKARIIVKEMLDLMVLDIVDKKVLTNKVTLNIGYDKDVHESYDGPMALDVYGRTVPKPVNGSVHLEEHTSSTDILMNVVLGIYDKVVDKKLGIRRINITFGDIINEDKIVKKKYVQMNLFTDYNKLEENEEKLKKEKKIQEAVLKIQNKYGKNSILKGTNYEDGATTIERNNRIGGHKA